MVKPSQPPADPCPFVNDDDPRCASRFTLERLSEAFELCMGGYRACSIYHRLARSRTDRLTHLTAHGRPLQPTGT